MKVLLKSGKSYNYIRQFHEFFCRMIFSICPFHRFFLHCDRNLQKESIGGEKKLKEVSSSLTWDALSSIMTSLMTCTLTAYLGLFVSLAKHTLLLSIIVLLQGGEIRNRIAVVIH